MVFPTPGSLSLSIYIYISTPVLESWWVLTAAELFFVQNLNFFGCKFNDFLKAPKFQKKSKTLPDFYTGFN